MFGVFFVNRKCMIDLIAIVKVGTGLKQIPLMCTHQSGKIRIDFPKILGKHSIKT